MKPRDEAHQRYLDTEPTELASAETELPLQTVFYDHNVSLEGLTEEHLWLGGVSTPRVIMELTRRLLEAEQQLAELKR
jgi:hypothetical protein